MAQKIKSYYTKAEEIGGIKARAKLSILTMVNSSEASVIPDSEDNILKFEKAMKHIVREFNGDVASMNGLRLKVLNLLLFKRA